MELSEGFRQIGYMNYIDGIDMVAHGHGRKYRNWLVQNYSDRKR
jgi:hypothetical protein